MPAIYFFDDFALDRKINVERRYFRPERFSEEPFVDPVSRAGYPSVYWCPEVGKHRMWYSRTTVPERDEQSRRSSHLQSERSFGQVWFQICDVGANPIPGFTFADCIPFAGDSLAHDPQWKEHTLSELKRRHIRLELKMHSAILFAVHGDFRPHHAAVAQVSYGNPKMADGTP